MVEKWCMMMSYGALRLRQVALVTYYIMEIFLYLPCAYKDNLTQVIVKYNFMPYPGLYLYIYLFFNNNSSIY